MTIAVADCPRCTTKSVTLDVKSSIQTRTNYNWQRVFEHHCVCRICNRSSILIGEMSHPDNSISAETLPNLKSLNGAISIIGHISIKDEIAEKSPESCPPDIAAAFDEGARCLALQCFNAAAAMFRLCLDLATRPLLPKAETEGLNSKTRRDLGLRLPWLFSNNLIPSDLKGLSECIREDGNDGAHTGLIKREDAEDILDFTREFLLRLYTEPARIRAAGERRKTRRDARKAQ